MILEILNLVLGIVFGFLHKGKEDYYLLLKNGLVAGLVLGIVFVLAAKYAYPGGISFDFSVFGMPGIFIEIFVFLIIFIIGAFIGDKLEVMAKR